MRVVRFIFITIFMCNLAYALGFQESVTDAKGALEHAKQILNEIDVNHIPNFTNNPKEANYLPSNQGDLEGQGLQYVAQHDEGRYLKELSENNQSLVLDDETKKRAALDADKRLDEKVSCQDGACIKVQDDDSDDFSEGLVELGALNGVAEDVRDKQVSYGAAQIFGGVNITCRVVFDTNRINFCKKDKHVFSASDGEKYLHKAQAQGRAIIAYPNTYCSKKKKRLGKRKCVEKRESWCVFQSKLARIMQIEARRQKNTNFGYVGEDDNLADCRGLTPEDISSIDFDTPEMKSALEEISKDFQNKSKFPSKSQLSQKIEGDVIGAQKGGQDAFNF